MDIVFYLPKFISSREWDETSSLFLDFIRETAYSYNATLYFVGGTDYAKKISHPHTMRVVDTLNEALQGRDALVLDNSAKKTIYEVRKPSVLILGPDDWGIQIDRFPTAKIPTPTSYPLWSAVAMGTALSVFGG